LASVAPPSRRPAHDDGHYFDTRPTSRSHPGVVLLTLPDISVRLRTDRGVFSPSRVDPGTKLLLSELPDVEHWPPGDVVDVGAGYGPIAVTLALRAPRRTVWAVEVNERAQELCRDNAAANGVADHVRVVGPEQVPADLTVGLVVSNPPIRIGKQALHELCRTWIRRLDPAGEAWWVVQKHLGSDSLQEWMQQQGWPTERVRSRQSYRVLRTAP